MEQASEAVATKRYAVVTGAGKGIGYETCRKLASKGIVVVLTARDEKRGLEAVQKLIDSGVPAGLLVFHQLDVADEGSIASLATFIHDHYGKLDILVNNAAIGGVNFNSEALQRATDLVGDWPEGENVNWKEIATQNSEMAEECLKTNYYGARGMVEALVPLLKLSDSPKIVNVSSVLGLLQNIPNEWARGQLNDIEGLTEERVDEVVNMFLKDFKDGLLEAKGWPDHVSAYIISKAAMNAYTRILAKRYPSLCVNSVCPGFCKTDITTRVGFFTAAEGAEHPARLALLPNGGPSGCFFSRKNILGFF